MDEKLKKFNKGFEKMLYEDKNVIEELKEKGALDEHRQILKWTQELEKLKNKKSKQMKKVKRLGGKNEKQNVKSKHK